MKIYLSPESDGGGGPSSGAGDPGAGGGAPAGGEGGAGAAPQYTLKSDFDSFASRMEQSFSRFQPREEKPVAKAEDGPAFPKISDRKYDWQKDPDGANEQYQRDVWAYRKGLDDKEAGEKSAKELTAKTTNGHNARVMEFLKANPDADQKFKNGNLGLLPEVRTAIMRHGKSAEVTNYLLDNPKIANELNFLMDSEDIDAVKYRIGEISASIRVESDTLKANTKAAGTKLVGFNNRGSSNGGTKGEPTMAERVKRYKEIR